MRRASMGYIIKSYPKHGYEVRYNGSQVWKEIIDQQKFDLWLKEVHRNALKKK